MYCPKCGSEYRPGLEECAFCHVPLVSEEPTPESASRTEPLVVVFASSRPDRVMVAESLLASVGIEAVTEGEWGSPMAAALGSGPMTVLVRASDEDAAREMLCELEPGDGEDASDLPYREHEDGGSPQGDTPAPQPLTEGDIQHDTDLPSPAISVRRALSETSAMSGFLVAAALGGGAELAVLELGDSAAMAAMAWVLAVAVNGYFLTFRRLVRLGELRLPGAADLSVWARRSGAYVVLGLVLVLLAQPVLFVVVLVGMVAPAIAIAFGLVFLTLWLLLVESSVLRYVAFDRVPAGLQYRQAVEALALHARELFSVIGWALALGAPIALLQWASGAALDVNHLRAGKGIVRTALEHPEVTTTIAAIADALYAFVWFGLGLVVAHMGGQLAAAVYPLREEEHVG